MMASKHNDSLFYLVPFRWLIFALLTFHRARNQTRIEGHRDAARFQTICDSALMTSERKKSAGALFPSPLLV